MSDFRIRRSLRKQGIGHLQIASGARTLREFQRRSAFVDSLIESRQWDALRMLHDRTLSVESAMALVARKRVLLPPRRGAGLVYVASCASTQRIKIGHTRNLAKRVALLSGGVGEHVELLASFPGTRKDERDAHERFAMYRLVGEWFRDVPAIRDWAKAQQERAA